MSKIYERPYTVRTFRCIKNFSAEDRYCEEGRIYEARVYVGDYTKLIFENGEMNFTNELFERTLDAWSDVLVEVEEEAE
ncbi:hypothetical protein [Enterococcus sp. AZ126]|uniref:hypothetical protein n=1 Tax=Enterococcus sp. AZ126 TaxID=2774635 RepID=UPI003F25239B